MKKLSCGISIPFQNRFVLSLLALAGVSHAVPLEVFRYSNADESSGQALHYMSGEPGNDVEGGWQFQSPEGKTFALNYR